MGSLKALLGDSNVQPGLATMTLKQRFSNLSVLPNHLEALLIYRFVGHHPQRVSRSRSGVGLKTAFLANSQVLLMLL